MSLTIRTIGLAAGVALLAAACGTATSSSSPGASSTFPNVSPSGAVGGASATPEPSGGSATPEPSGGTGGDVTAMIPALVGETALTVRTATPTDLPIFDGPVGAAAISALGSALGVDPSQMRAAVGSNSDGSLVVGVLDLPGVDATAIQNALPLALAQPDASAGTQGTVGGRSVTTFSVGGATVYLYASTSRIYAIKSMDKALADQVLGVLP